MGHGSSNYITGGLQTVIGATATAMGAPEIGVPMMMGGVGQLSGQAAGGSQGAATGGALGSLAGGGYEGYEGLGGMSGISAGLKSLLGGSSTPTGSGFAMPGSAGTPTTGQMAGSLPSFIDPNQIIGASVDQAPTPGSSSSSGAKFGQVASLLSPLISKLGGSSGPSQQQPQPPTPQPMQQARPQQPPMQPPQMQPSPSPTPAGQMAQNQMMSPQIKALLGLN